MEEESSHPDKKGLQQMMLPTSARSCSPPTAPPIVPTVPCLSGHPAQLLVPPVPPVHAVDGLQVGQGFADLQGIENERGHGQTGLVLLQVLAQLQRDE